MGLAVGVVLLVAVVGFLCWCAYDVGYDRGWAYRSPWRDADEASGAEGDGNAG